MAKDIFFILSEEEYSPLLPLRAFSYKCSPLHTGSFRHRLVPYGCTSCLCRYPFASRQAACRPIRMMPCPDWPFVLKRSEKGVLNAPIYFVGDFVENPVFNRHIGLIDDFDIANHRRGEIFFRGGYGSLAAERDAECAEFI